MKGPRRPVAITLLLALAMVGVFGMAITGCSGSSNGASTSSAKSVASQAQKDNLKTLNVGSDLYPRLSMPMSTVRRLAWMSRF